MCLRRCCHLDSNDNTPNFIANISELPFKCLFINAFIPHFGFISYFSVFVLCLVNQRYGADAQHMRYRYLAAELTTICSSSLHLH